MTVELVDGHAGTPHIDGDDLGDFKAGFIGSDGYVLDRGDCFAATLNSANSLSIGTGSAIMPNTGRHVRVTAPETLTIVSGTAGMYRYDLVVLRAETTDGTSVESASLVVIQGTSTSGTPTDPDTQDGDLPLYRLSLDGITVTEPIALFDVLVPYAEFRDSVSQKLLWSNSNGYYMHSGQTINLASPISEQHRGIILHWQGYISGESAQNYDHNYTFIPKQHIENAPGQGVSCILSGSTGNRFSCKYVYVRDTSITGNDNNSQTVTRDTSGITFSNNYFVLTEVYGV